MRCLLRKYIVLKYLCLANVLLLACLAGSVLAETDTPPLGFNGIAFGAKLSDIDGLVPVSEKVNQSKERFKDVYCREKENLRLGEALAHSVAYYFQDDRMRSVVVVIKGDADAFLVKDYMIELYGPGRQVGSRYGWTWSNFSMVIERLAENDMSILTYTLESVE